MYQPHRMLTFWSELDPDRVRRRVQDLLVSPEVFRSEHQDAPEKFSARDSKPKPVHLEHCWV
jgi:hypothetical protein